MPQLKGTGTDDKKKVAVAAALGFMVLALAYHTLFGGPAANLPPASVPASAPAAAPVRSAAPVNEVGGRLGSDAGAGVGVADSSLDPALHPELMAENENYLYAGNGRNIFSGTAEAPAAAAIPIPKVTGKVRPQPVNIAAVSTGPPPPPTIDLRFFGYAARGNGARRAFLLHGDDVFVASEGDVVSHRYRVVRIAPTSIDIEDLPYHDTQTLPLTQN